MRLTFIGLFMYDTGADNKGGGFSTEEKAYIDQSLNKVQSVLEGKVGDAAKKALKEELPEQLKTLNDFMGEMKTGQKERGDWESKTQEAIDKLLTDIKEINKNGGSVKQAASFQQAIAEAMAKQENVEGLKSVSKGKPFRIKLEGAIDMSTKAVADMTLGNNLTGDSVITYNQRQAILPAQKINFRDLIPTVMSDTGLYVTYRETGTEGAIGIQTEGSEKSQIDYDFTEVKTVNKFIAGFARFSRQMMRSLPFLQNTLPRLLLRDFYAKENSYFVGVVKAAATGSSTTTETDDVKQLIDWIANQSQANFNASFIILSHKMMAALNKLLYTNGYYQGSGGVLSQPDGSIRISGVPIIPVSWMESNDKALIIDNDFIERVQVEGLALEFFEQDYKNVTENKMTARIECYEEINPMLPASIILGDFGNSSSS